MTKEDEFYFNAVKDSIREYIRTDVKMGGNHQTKCLEEARQKIERIYKWNTAHTFSLFSHKRKKEDPAELQGLLQRLEPELVAFVEAAYLSTARQQKVCQINQATAQSILEPTLESWGYECEVEYQRFQAKLYIRISPSRIARLYVSYKRIYEEGYLDDIPRTVEALKEMINKYGRNFTVSNYR